MRAALACAILLLALLGGCAGPSPSATGPGPTPIVHPTPPPTPEPLTSWRLVHEAIAEPDAEAVIASDLVFGDAGFLALTIRLKHSEGGPQETGQSLWHSENGTGWTELPVPTSDALRDESVERLTTSRDGENVVFSRYSTSEIGAGQTETRAQRSADGVTWTEVDTGLPADMTVLGVHHGPNASILVGYGGGEDRQTGIWRSTDGLAWELAVELEQRTRYVDISGAGAGPEEFVVVGTFTDLDLGAYEYFALTSTDAVNWALATPDLAQEEGMMLSPALAAFGNGWLAALHTGLIGGIQMVDLWTSPDGEAWARAGRIERTEQLSSFLPRFVEAAGRLYFSTDGGRHDQHSPGIWTSDDARDWDELDLGLDAVLGGIATGNGATVMSTTTWPEEGVARAAFWLGFSD